MDRKVREAVGCSRASEKRCQLKLWFEGVDASARADHSGSKQGISSIVGTDVITVSPGRTILWSRILPSLQPKMRASSVGMGQIRVDKINTTCPAPAKIHLARPTNDQRLQGDVRWVRIESAEGPKVRRIRSRRSSMTSGNLFHCILLFRSRTAPLKPK
jgi:hypothetical protein